MFAGWLLGYTCIPFGWKASAVVYQSTGMQITSYLRSYGILTTQYIDDRMAAMKHVVLSGQEFLNSYLCLSKCNSIVYIILAVLTRLGYTLAIKNVSCSPNQISRVLCRFDSTSLHLAR